MERKRTNRDEKHLKKAGARRSPLNWWEHSAVLRNEHLQRQTNAMLLTKCEYLRAFRQGAKFCLKKMRR